MHENQKSTLALTSYAQSALLLPRGASRTRRTAAIADVNGAGVRIIRRQIDGVVIDAQRPQTPNQTGSARHGVGNGARRRHTANVDDSAETNGLKRTLGIRN